jgi:regulator of extracellular matrix RemA (YlzA/DUF370 family)
MELLDIEEVGTTALPPAERAALALDSGKAERHLTELASKHASIVEVKDKAGREQAHGAAMELTRARTAVERAAKEAREDATKFSKAVIAEAARLVAIVEPEETRLKAVRDAWDAEQARIKAEAEAKERARVLAITERIAAIKSYVVLANNCRTSERVADLHTKLSGVELVGFEEFEAEAVEAHAMAMEHLRTVHADRKAQEEEAARVKAEQESEAARLKAEREELARQRAEVEEAARVAAKAAADERAKMEAELAAQRAAARAQQEAAEKAVAEQRAELERMRAELEAKTKPAEQPVCTAEHQAPALPDPEPAPEPAQQVEVAEAPRMVLPHAPAASAIVLAVAEFWHTDTKTATRWIVERAAEIATLKG